jgi:hypothetical protein
VDKDVANDMSWSARLFLGQVYPMIRQEIGGGKIIVMEGRPDSELAKILDIGAGIDCWHITNQGGVRGIASRVQKGDKVWGTFTVRKSRSSGAETEYAKRKRAICSDGGEIYPQLTIQAYAQTETGPVLAAAVCRTKDLINYIDTKNTTVKQTGNASFYVCSWVGMQNASIDVRVVISDFGQGEFNFMSPIYNYEKRMKYKKYEIPNVVFAGNKITQWETN